MLCYLAYQGRWVQRDEILYLFWPDHDESRARTNLRQLLFTIKSLPWTTKLEASGQQLRWAVRTDTSEFRAAFTANDWAKAFDLYPGPLLQHMRLTDSPEFDTWLQHERSSLHDSYRSASLQLAEGLAATGRINDADKVIGQALYTDPLDDALVLRRLSHLLDHGMAEDARQRYEEYAALLANELGAEPSPEMLRVMGSGAATIAISGRPVGTRRYEISPEAKAFIGRQRQLAEIADAVGSSGCRLLTLLAPGGMGKTSLARQLGVQLQASFGAGAVFIPLETVTDEEGLVAALMKALNVPLYGGDKPFSQLLAAIKDLHLLLILDNLEQLDPAAATIDALLNASPSLKVLATSRTRLGLAAEWVYELPGLAVPMEGAEQPWCSESEQLFVLRAKQLGRVFLLDQANASAVAAITHAVGGMPLAVELAANWLRALTPTEIAAELVSGLDLQTTEGAGTAPRHQGIRQVLEQSWQRLNTKEQAALRCLSVFAGGFDFRSAREVAAVELPTLLSLTNHALLIRTPQGRFEQHPLLHQLSREHSGAFTAERARMLERHARHFLTWACEQGSGPHRHDVGHIAASLASEHENLVSAWRQASKSGPHELVVGAHEVMATYYSTVAKREEWHELNLLLETSAPPGSLAQACARLALARHAASAQDLGKACQLAEEAAAAFERNGDRHGWAQAVRLLGVTSYLQGNNDSALARFVRSREAFLEIGELEDAATTGMNIAIVYYSLTRHEEAQAMYRDSMAVVPGNAHVDRSNILHNWSLLELNLGNRQEALRLAEEALASGRRAGHPEHLVRRQYDLGMVLKDMGRLDEAEQCYQQMANAIEGLSTEAQKHYSRLRLHENHGHLELLRGNLVKARHHLSQTDCIWLPRLLLEEGKSDEAKSLALKQLATLRTESPDLARNLWESVVLHGCLAEVELTQDHTPAALQHLTEATAAALRSRLPAFLSFCMPTWVHYLWRSCDAPLALQAAAFALHHPANCFDDHMRMQRLLEQLPELESALKFGPPEDLSDMFEFAQSLCNITLD